MPGSLRKTLLISRASHLGVDCALALLGCNFASLSLDC